MARPQSKATHLHETPSAAPHGAPVIDVDFTVIAEGRARRPMYEPPARKSLARRVKGYLKALTIAALIGVMIPPTVLLARALLG